MKKYPVNYRLVCLPFFLLVCSAAHLFGQQAKRVWIDADTGNETDDVYALVRLLAEPGVVIAGISSAHFNNADLVAFEKWNQYDTKGIHTVQISQQLNEELLAILHKSAILHPLGADRQMGRAWGGMEPRNSPAAQAIIQAVKQLPGKEKLIVVSLGALTNIASAIALDTTIASRIVCYALGAKYNIEKEYWNKSEFNIRNDLNAFDYLLDHPSVNLVIMPTDVVYSFRFEKDALYKILRSGVPVENLLKQRWEETNPQDAVRTLWDLALVEALLKPELAATREVLTPPENTRRKVTIFTGIRAEEMKKDFYAAVKSIP